MFEDPTSGYDGRSLAGVPGAATTPIVLALFLLLTTCRLITRALGRLTGY